MYSKDRQVPCRQTGNVFEAYTGAQHDSSEQTEMLLRRVLQRGDKDCGVACVAMLANRSYTDACGLVHPDRRTKTKELSDALTSLGLECGRRLKPLGKKSYRDLECDAVLKVWPRKDRSWHWVVWDARRKRVLDPWEPPYMHIHATSYLPVTRLTTP